jgi:hypothetical protein
LPSAFWKNKLPVLLVPSLPNDIAVAFCIDTRPFWDPGRYGKAVAPGEDGVHNFMITIVGAHRKGCGKEGDLIDELFVRDFPSKACHGVIWIAISHGMQLSLL